MGKGESQTKRELVSGGARTESKRGGERNCNEEEESSPSLGAKGWGTRPARIQTGSAQCIGSSHPFCEKAGHCFREHRLGVYSSVNGAIAVAFWECYPSMELAQWHGGRRMSPEAAR